MLWSKYEGITQTPSPPLDPGTVRLAFDRPNVPAKLEVRVTDRGDIAELDYVITVEGEHPYDQVGYSLITTGRAQMPDEPEYNGGPRRKSNGCWHTLQVIPAMGLVCRDVQTPKGGIRGNSPVPGQAVTGLLRRNESEAMFVQVVAGIDDRALEQSEGKRTYFRLPSIGIANSPAGLQLDYGVGRSMHRPSTLTLTIEYMKEKEKEKEDRSSYLEPNQRLDTVTPEPSEPGRLAWAESDASSVAPLGSITDIDAEERNQRDLFVLGIVAGIAVSIFSEFLIAGMRKLNRYFTGSSS
jgi:hypothetical protein